MAGPFPSLDSSSYLVKVLPFHSAKGLTFDSVLLPCVTAAGVHARSPRLFWRLLLVALARAVSWG